MGDLQGKKVAVLATGGVEEVELTQPVSFLRERGADVTIVTPKLEELQEGIPTLHDVHCGGVARADAVLADVSPEQFDALFIPGGWSPDHLRLAPEAARFVEGFADKPIFALCHGPLLLIDAHLVDGRTVTSWPSVEIDLENAGAHWVDEAVVVDGNLITSRKPADIPAFDAVMEDILSNPSSLGFGRAA